MYQTQYTPQNLPQQTNTSPSLGPTTIPIAISSSYPRRSGLPFILPSLLKSKIKKHGLKMIGEYHNESYPRRSIEYQYLREVTGSHLKYRLEEKFKGVKTDDEGNVVRDSSGKVKRTSRADPWELRMIQASEWAIKAAIEVKKDIPPITSKDSQGLATLSYHMNFLRNTYNDVLKSKRDALFRQKVSSEKRSERLQRLKDIFENENRYSFNKCLHEITSNTWSTLPLEEAIKILETIEATAISIKMFLVDNQNLKLQSSEDKIMKERSIAMVETAQVVAGDKKNTNTVLKVGQHHVEDAKELYYEDTLRFQLIDRDDFNSELKRRQDVEDNFRRIEILDGFYGERSRSIDNFRRIEIWDRLYLDSLVYGFHSKRSYSI